MTQMTGQFSEKMTSGLDELYQEVIVEHSKRPRFKGRVEGCRFCQEGKNPLCGDQITVFCRVETSNDSTLDVATQSPLPKLYANFDGAGCSISQASASMMCQAVQGLSPTEARMVVRHAERIYTGKELPTDQEDFEDDVEALFGVSKFPVRIKCAALAWKTLEIVLNEHFDEQGRLKTTDAGCEQIRTCATSRKLKVVSTEL